MNVLTEDAVLKCLHRGVVRIRPSQTLVRIDTRFVLVEPNPEDRDIDRCPNRGPTIKKCGKTLKVRSGYSTFLRIDGKPVCLDSVSGLTNGTPPGLVKYRVFEAGQDFVAATS